MGIVLARLFRNVFAPLLNAVRAPRPAVRLKLGLVLGTSLLAAAPALAGTSYVFTGSAVSGCTLSGNTYTCASLSLPNWNDSVSIGNGYTVKVNSSVTFGHNHTLSMSGNAQLAVTGDLNIGHIAPSNLNISGGTLTASGTFSFGIQAQTMTANVSAASITLGTGSTVTGTITSSGPVSIGSHATVNGPISGTVVSTNSHVTLRGEINATTSFTLASHSSVTGDITAPVVLLRPSDSSVSGDIVATTSLELGSSVSVTGDVRTANLTLKSSEAIINGSATVSTADLGWHGRVTETIYCTGGTINGQCDCVNNKSGYSINTPLGPSCASATPPPSASLDHFLVMHNGTATACVPETVTVIACANAACTPPHYSGGATFTLSPNDVSTTYTIGSSGVNSGTVTALTGNPVAISLSSATTASSGPQCLNTSNNSKSCTLAVTDTAGFVVNVPNHAAGTTQNLTLQAVQLNSKNQCVPAFANVTKTITLSPTFLNPSSSQSAVTIAGSNVSPGRTANVAMAFNASGIATTSLVSADVGLIQIGASYSTMSSQGSFIAAPAYLAVSNLPPGASAALPRAGDKFTFTVGAYNSANNLTPNFGTESPSAESVNASFIKCSGANTGQFTLSSVSAFAGGKGTVTAIWSEVGTLTPRVSLVNTGGYLGSNIFPTGGGDCNNPSNVAGPFIPAYFEVVQAAPQKPGEQAQTFYYSGQPMALTQGTAGVVITARNRNGGTTTNYTQSVALNALAADGSPLAAGSGVLTVPQYPAFSNGQLSLTPAYAFSSAPAAPLKVRLRASNGVASPNEVTSKDAEDASKEFTPEIRFGRLRLFAFAGYADTDLKMPARVEYWTGQSWIQNTLDSYTVVPAASVALTPVGGFSGASAASSIQFASGSGTLLLHPTPSASPSARIGAVDVALNLGATGPDNSCLSSHPSVSAANIPYLRSRNGSCATTYDRDPSARATFGVFAPDTKRMIHVREVFN